MEQEVGTRYIISTMAECEDLRELEGEEEEETRGSKEHNGGAGFFQIVPPWEQYMYLGRLRG